MIPINQYLLVSITILLSFIGQAQSIYESPHVKDGKTIRFTIPKDYNSMGESENPGYQQFASHADMDIESDDIETLSASAITISHMPVDGQTLESLKADLQQEMSEDGDVVVMRNPVIENINGRDFILAAYMGGNFDVRVDRIYFGITRFGDYYISTFYFSTKGIENGMDYKTYQDFLATWDEVPTTKENTLTSEDYTYLDDDESNYKNDLFETGFYFLDILPDYGDYWDEPVDENSHLLSEFFYKNENGSVKIFSGGSASDYQSKEEMANAIELAMDWTKSMKLEFNSDFSNEYHQFKLYTISGGGTMSAVYTLIVSGELLFFVVDAGPNPVDDFKSAVPEFMLTMWIDSYDEEEPIDEE